MTEQLIVTHIDRPRKEWHCWHEIHHSMALGDCPEDIAHYIRYRGWVVPPEVFVDRSGNILFPIHENALA